MTPQKSSLRLTISWSIYDPEHEAKPSETAFIEDPEWRVLERSPIEWESKGWVFTSVHCCDILIWPQSARIAEAEDMLEEHLNLIRLQNPAFFPGYILPKWQARVASIEASPLEASEPIRMRHDARLDWATLVAPDSDYNDISIRNPHNSLRIDCVFEAYAQLIKSSKGYEDKGRWTTMTVARVITPDANHEFGFGFSPSPITSFNDLKARFQHALLAKSHSFMNEWRAATGISLNSSIELAKRVSQKPLPMRQALRDMFECKGFILPVSLNPYHEGARNVLQTIIALDPDGFRFLLYYGYEGSVWSHELARTRLGEPFDRTCERAHKAFLTLFPDAAAQRNAIAIQNRCKGVNS